MYVRRAEFVRAAARRVGARASGRAAARAAAFAVRAVPRIVLALVVCWPLVAAAQRDRAPRFEDAPLPPRVDDVVSAERATAQAAARNPNRARLAPLPADREEPVDEIVVTAENAWRLPDLGSDWRAEREAELESRRYVFALFPREDTIERYDNPFLVNPGAARSGSIGLFRWRLGQRDTDAEDDAEP